MSCIAICIRRKITSSEAFALNLLNPHGIGMAWTDNGKVLIRKGMNLSQFHSWYRRFFPFPHLVHFWNAGSGLALPELSHPFPLLPTTPTKMEWSGPVPVLAHDGHWDRWHDALMNWDEMSEARASALRGELDKNYGRWSDTRTLAALMGFLITYRAVSLEQIVQFADSENIGKLAILTPEGKVYTAGPFYETDGILLSQPDIPFTVEYVTSVIRRIEKSIPNKKPGGAR